MTPAKLKEHLTYHARQLATQASNGAPVQFPIDKLDSFIDTVIEAGLGDFWAARRWPFRRLSYTIPIAVSANPYKLPDDFAAMSSIVDITSGAGHALEYIDKEEFDRRYPNPAYHSTGSERFYSIGMIQGENNYQLWLMPIPTVGNVIPMTYFTTAPATCDAVPNSHISGLLAACTKYLFRMGSPERNDAMLYADAVYNRLESIPAFNAELPNTTAVVGAEGPDWSPFP